MALGALIIKTRLSLTDEEMAEQIKENPYLQFFIGLEAFEYSALFDPSMKVCFCKRLAESVLNVCNERITLHGLAVIEATASQDDHDDDPGSGADNSGYQHETTPEAIGNQGSLLIDATCTPADIRYPVDLSLLNEAREVTEMLIDAMHPLIRDGFGPKPCTHRRKARREFLAVAKKRYFRVNKFFNAIKQQLAHMERNLTSIDVLIACGASLLTTESH